MTLTPDELSAGVAYREMKKQPSSVDVMAIEGRRLGMRRDPVYGKWIVTLLDVPMFSAMQMGHGWINRLFRNPPCQPGDRIPYVASSSLEARECTTNWEAFVTVTEVKPVKRERWEWRIEFEKGE